MRLYSSFARTVLLVLLFTATVGSAHAQIPWWEKCGAVYGLISSIVYTPDSKNIIFAREYRQGFRINPTLILQYNIATTRIDTLVVWKPEQSFSPIIPPGGSVACLQWEQDSDSLVVWSLHENKPLFFFSMEDTVGNHLQRKIAFSSNGTDISLVITNQQGAFLRRYNVYNGVLQRSFPIVPTYSTYVGTPYVSNDGETVALFTGDNNQQLYIEFWRTSTGEHFAHPLPAFSSELTVSGKHFAYVTKARDTTIAQDIYSGAVVATIPMLQQFSSMQLVDGGHSIVGSSLSFVGHKSSLYTAFYIDIQKPTVVTSTSSAFAIQAAPLPMFAPDRTSFVLLYKGYTSCYFSDTPWEIEYDIASIGIYKAGNGNCIASFPEGHFLHVTDIEASPDGVHAASAAHDQQTLLWDVTTATIVGRNPGSGILAFSNDAATLFRASEIDSSLAAIAIPSMATQQRIPLVPNKPNILRTAPSNSFLLCASANQLAVYTQEPLQNHYTIPIDTTYTIADAGFSATGDSIIAILLPTQHNTTLLVATWQAGSGKQLSSVNITDTASFRPNVLLLPGAKYFTTLTTTASVRHTRDGAIIRTLPAAPVTSISNGEYLVYAKKILYTTDYVPPPPTHILYALSVDTPTKDFTFDTPIGSNENISLLTFPPSGKQVLYTDSRTCIPPTLFSSRLDADFHRLQSKKSTVNLDFVKTGETKKEESVLYASLPLHKIIHSIQLSDSSVLDFCTITYNRTLPDTINENTHTNSRIIAVSCSPIYNKPIDFFITVYYAGHAYTDSLTIRVVGTVLPPTISTTKNAIDFGRTRIGTPVADSLTVVNNSQASLYISSLSIDDPDNSHRAAYSITTAPPLWLPPTGKLPITVSYLPNSEDSLRAFLVLHTNDPQTPQLRIPLTGKGFYSTDVHTTTPHANTMNITPNPASSTLQLSFAMRASGFVRAQLFSAQGKLVRTWLAQPTDAGTHTHTFSVENIPPALYYCVLSTPAGTHAEPVLITP